MRNEGDVSCGLVSTLSFHGSGRTSRIYAKLDPKDPESLSKSLRQTLPDAANDSIRKAIFFGWWLLPHDRRTDENLEREIRRLVDDAIREFRNDKDRFLNPDPFASPAQIALGRDLLLEAGQDRLGSPDDRIRDRITSITESERLQYLFRRVYEASSWDDLIGGA